MREEIEIFVPTAEIIVMAHGRAISLFGGAKGVRDISLLHSALGRAEARAIYDADAGIASIAAAATFGIVKNHPFIDGNKRAALTTLELTLQMNCYELYADAEEKVLVMIDLASGRLTEEEFSSWVNQRSHPNEALRGLSAHDKEADPEPEKSYQNAY
jgi:death-on-curing protein